MTVVQIFPYAIAVLQIIAGGVYTWQGGYRLAVVWIGCGIANWAFAGVTP